MDKPRCNNCGAETEWYGWLHGWLCVACEAGNLEAAADEEDVDRQKHSNQKKLSASKPVDRHMILVLPLVERPVP